MNPTVINKAELRPTNDISATGELLLWLPGISLLRVYFYLVVFPGLIFKIYWYRLLFLTALQREKSNRVLWFENYFAQAAKWNFLREIQGWKWACWHSCINVRKIYIHSK